MCRGKVVHFFGFRGVEYISAVRVWGVPDFVHPVHDRRAYVEYDPANDTPSPANKETSDRVHYHPPVSMQICEGLTKTYSVL